MYSNVLCVFVKCMQNKEFILEKLINTFYFSNISKLCGDYGFLKETE